MEKGNWVQIIRNVKKTIMLFFFPFLVHGWDISAQELATPNTWLKAEKPISADIGDVQWIAGHWQGEALGGMVEEIWSPPAAGAMMGSFRLVKNDTVQFYEFQLIQEMEESLVVKVKHFNNDMTSWEEKEEYVLFPLVKIEENRVYFEKLTYEKADPDHLKIYLAMKTKSGYREVVFNYKRIK